MWSKDEDKKFSGDVGECWMDYVDDYLQVAVYHNISPPQNLQYLHNLLPNEAKRFYIELVAKYTQPFQQAVDLVNKNYN